jgi:hypothetical protein
MLTEFDTFNFISKPEILVRNPEERDHLEVRRK